MSNIIDTLSGLYSLFEQSYLCGTPPRWKTPVTDVAGKIALVTGGNSGTGKELAKYLLKANAKVYLACRNEESARVAIDELKVITGKEARFLKLDLADLDSVKGCVDEFLRNEVHLDLLFNNAGVLFPPQDEVSSTGIEYTFAVNVLGHFYLTKLLIPTLLSTYKETGSKPRVVTVTSVMAYLASLDLESVMMEGVEKRERMGDTRLYNQSKLANILFAMELAERYERFGIVSVAVNPGNLKTNLNRTFPTRASWLEAFASKVVQIYPAEWGGLQLLYAGTCLNGERLSGQLVVPWMRIGKSPKKAVDVKTRKELWEWLEGQCEMA